MNSSHDSKMVPQRLVNPGKVETITPVSIKSKTPVPRRPPKDDFRHISNKKSQKKHNFPKKDRTHSTKNYGSLNPDLYLNELQKHRNKGTNSFEAINGSKEIQRPASVVNKSFLNHLELAKKVKAVKRYSNPAIIDKLIKKSLMKAKTSKVSKEKELKQSYLQSEIKKKEMSYQNRQIRIQNSLKFHRKKSKHKKQVPSTHNPSNVCTIISDNSNNLKKSESISIKKVKKHLRNSNLSDYSVMKQLDLAPYNRQHPKYNKENSNGLPPRHTPNTYLPELSRDHSFSSGNVYSEILQSASDEEASLHQRNFSFIYENNDDASIEKVDKENSIFGESSEKSLDSAKGLNKGYSEILQNSLEDSCKQPDFDIETSKIAYIFAHRSFKVLSSQTQTFRYTPPSKKILSVQKQPAISTPHKPRPPLSVSYLPSISCFQSLPQLILTPSTLISLPPTPSQFKSLYSEELSSTLSHIFLLEQLKLQELSVISDLSKMISLEIQTKLIYEIEQKYSSILAVLKPEAEEKYSKFARSLDKEESYLLMQASQKKKQAVHKLLRETSEKNRGVIAGSVGNESSSSESSAEDQQGAGIAHSRSVIRLHEDFYQKAEGLQDKSVDIDFGFNEDILEQPTDVSGKNSMPLLKLSLQPIECEVSDPRRICAVDVLCEFVSKVMQGINQKELIDNIKRPLEKNALAELDKLQDLQIGTFVDNELRTFESLFDFKKMMEIELYEGSEFKDQQVLKAENICKRMILEVLNYLFQQFRPYGVKGKPLPWCKFNAEFKLNLEFSEVQKKITAEFEKICRFAIGKTEDLESSVGEDESMILRIKEQQIDKVIHYELETDEKKWIDYEFEETQVKLDLADMILYELALEVININTE